MASRYQLGTRLWLFGIALLVLLLIGFIVQAMTGADPGGAFSAQSRTSTSGDGVPAAWNAQLGRPIPYASVPLGAVA